MKFISPKIHAWLDIGVAIVLFLAPSVLRMTSVASNICYILGVAYVAIIVFTAYPFGVVKALPFTVHGTIELVLAPFLVAMPWLARFSQDMHARVFFVVAGLALFLVWLTTDYKAADIAYRKRGVDLGDRGRIRGATA
jgi:hypothetical protein